MTKKRPYDEHPRGAMFVKYDGRSRLSRNRKKRAKRWRAE